jgi:hypothetical protein
MSLRHRVAVMAVTPLLTLGWGAIAAAGIAHADEQPPAGFCAAAANIATALQKPTTAVQPAKAKAVVKSLQANADSMPSSLKTAIQQLEAYLKKVAAAGNSISKLGAATHNSSKYNKAGPKFVDYYNANC